MKITMFRCVAAATVMGLSPLAVAAPIDDARALIAQEKHAEALTLLDGQLSNNPQDAEARFTRGLVLVRLNRTDEAIKAFSALTRDYPQLPEPYNNLAVLYAQQGNYEKARDALEAALATSPSYPTAHENLGDIYAALAGAAYNRALTLDQNNGVVRAKLNLIGQLDQVPANATSSLRQSAAPKAAPPRAALPAPVVTAKASPPATAEETAAINGLLTAWSQAWSSKNVDGYFAAYADDFAPERGQSLEAWQGQRRGRIEKPQSISVRALNPQITMADANRAVLSFQQAYQSDNFNDQVTKVLELKRVDGGWKITREYTQ